jgi:glutathione S-transferase
MHADALTALPGAALKRRITRKETPAMKLYYAPGACSLSPHIVLRESGAKFDLSKVDFATRKTAEGQDFNSINPKGLVPALRLDDGEVLTEGAAIVQYIADKQGATSLAPAAGTKARVRLQEWLNFIASELHKGFSPLFNSKTPEEYRVIVKDNLAKKFAYLDDVLGDRNYLLDENFTVADAYLFTIMNWRHALKVDISTYKNLSAYLDRVGSRPKVKEAMQAEGLLKAA